MKTNLPIKLHALCPIRIINISVWCPPVNADASGILDVWCIVCLITNTITLQAWQGERAPTQRVSSLVKSLRISLQYDRREERKTKGEKESSKVISTIMFVLYFCMSIHQALIILQFSCLVKNKQKNPQTTRRPLTQQWNIEIQSVVYRSVMCNSHLYLVLSVDFCSCLCLLKLKKT